MAVKVFCTILLLQTTVQTLQISQDSDTREEQGADKLHSVCNRGCALLCPSTNLTKRVPVLCLGLYKPYSKKGGSHSPVYRSTDFSHSEIAAASEIQLLAPALSFPILNTKLFPLFHLDHTNFLRCCLLQSLFFIQM